MKCDNSQDIIKQQMYAFMERHPLMVISSVENDTNIPQSALVAFAQTSELEVIFQTQRNTRKYVNLQHNHSVSLVIGWDEKSHVTMQYQGIATKISDSDLPGYISFFKLKETPCTDDFIYHPLAIFFKITPVWIALSDYTGSKPEVLEYWPNVLNDEVSFFEPPSR